MPVMEDVNLNDINFKADDETEALINYLKEKCSAGTIATLPDRQLRFITIRLFDYDSEAVPNMKRKQMLLDIGLELWAHN